MCHEYQKQNQLNPAEQALSVKSLFDKGASHNAFGCSCSVESEERSVIHGVSHRNTNMRHIFHVWTDNVAVTECLVITECNGLLLTLLFSLLVYLWQIRYVIVAFKVSFRFYIIISYCKVLLI